MTNKLEQKKKVLKNGLANNCRRMIKTTRNKNYEKFVELQNSIFFAFTCKLTTHVSLQKWMAFQVDEEPPNLSIRIRRPSFLRTDNAVEEAEVVVADVAFPT